MIFMVPFQVRPQHHYVFDAEGRCLVDELLRFETLGHDMHRLLSGHEARTTAVTTPGAPHLAAYDDRQLLDLVNELYARDFECFSYERL